MDWKQNSELHCIISMNHETLQCTHITLYKKKGDLHLFIFVHVPMTITCT